MADLSQIDEEIGGLYGLRPGEFVAARDALAKRLRGEGRRAEADAVKALQRPTLAAWAVNQLSRLEPEWTQALANAGRRLEEAQAALLAHGDRQGWREATAAQREAVERLLGLAERLVREERGAVTPAMRDQIRETLQAASIDPDAGAAVCAGRLAKELRAAGGLGAASAGAAPRTPSGARAPEPTPERAPAASSPARSAAAEREARAARRTAERDARAALRRAERLVTAARAAAERADKAHARARKAHDAAADALADAQAAERARAEELAAAEAVAREAAEGLAERRAAEAQARAALESLTD
ncbi:MAG TPA: hypothetical protein VFR97_05710 [Capillimicrobium sp.]|nr:hypothetical protein [Capillimicrobium sp.]